MTLTLAFFFTASTTTTTIIIIIVRWLDQLDGIHSAALYARFIHSCLRADIPADKLVMRLATYVRRFTLGSTTRSPTHGSVHIGGRIALSLSYLPTFQQRDSRFHPPQRRHGRTSWKKQETFFYARERATNID
eukprot:GEZU01027271.1.p2 GENE.GEZU01027271.1~~GEZU01027271.1.p2  ORF type:complete len:133 (+),score=18.53 GEZU01027271.1:584-982(+)